MKKRKSGDITKLLPGVEKNILLKNYTTFKIGGKAKYFFVAKNEKDLILSVNAAKKANLPFFILAGGSNILVSDKGFDGLVIKIQNTGYKMRDVRVEVEAGVLLFNLTKACLKTGLTGLEWAAGIPGTVGGATRGNAAAFGYTISNSIRTVKVFDAVKKQIKILKNKDCDFASKTSIFKKNKNVIILSVILRLKKGKKEEIKNKINKYLSYRRGHHPLNFPSAGSIFVNPEGYFAAELIEKCGLKGKKIGKAQISKKHSNFIINLRKAEALDVKKLINLAKKKVKQKFGIILKEEIGYL